MIRTATAFWKIRQRKLAERQREERRFQAALAFAVTPGVDSMGRACDYPSLEEAVAAADRLIEVLDCPTNRPRTRINTG